MSLPLKFDYKDILKSGLWYKLKKLYAACMWKLPWARWCQKFYYGLFQRKQHWYWQGNNIHAVSTDRTTMDKLASSVDE